MWFWCVSSTKLGNLSSYSFFLLFWPLLSSLLLLSIPASFWKPPRPAKNTPDTKNEQEGIHGDTPHTCIQHTGGDLWRRESHGAVHSFTHWDQNHSMFVAHMISTQSAHDLMWGSHDQHMISCEGHMIGTISCGSHDQCGVRSCWRSCDFMWEIVSSAAGSILKTVWWLLSIFVLFLWWVSEVVSLTYPGAIGQRDEAWPLFATCPTLLVHSVVAQHSAILWACLTNSPRPRKHSVVSQPSLSPGRWDLNIACGSFDLCTISCESYARA